MPPLLAVNALLAPALAAAPPATEQGALQVTSHLLVERRVAARDGTTRIVLAEAVRVRPGDRLVVTLAWRNTSHQPIADLMLADPVPAALAYRGAAEGSPAPDLSVDGRDFAPLAALTVASPAGGTRPAAAADVVAVRWRFDRPLAPGATGSVGFRAVLK